MVKHVTIKEEVVNISPTISHAHNGVDNGVVGFVECFRGTTLDVNVAFV